MKADPLITGVCGVMPNSMGLHVFNGFRYFLRAGLEHRTLKISFMILAFESLWGCSYYLSTLLDLFGFEQLASFVLVQAWNIAMVLG